MIKSKTIPTLHENELVYIELCELFNKNQTPIWNVMKMYYTEDNISRNT